MTDFVARAERLEKERNHWIRLFNRLDAAVSRWATRKSYLSDSDDVDDELRAAHQRVLKAAAGDASADAETLIDWLREGADELEKAHVILDQDEVPRSLPGSDVACTLAARIAMAQGDLP